MCLYEKLNDNLAPTFFKDLYCQPAKNAAALFRSKALNVKIPVVYEVKETE